MTGAGMEQIVSRFGGTNNKNIMAILMSTNATYTRERYDFDNLTIENDNAVLLDKDDKTKHYLAGDQVNTFIVYDKTKSYNLDENGNEIPHQPIFYQG